MTTGSKGRDTRERTQMLQLRGRPATLDLAHPNGKGRIFQVSGAMPPDVAVMFSLLIKQIDRLRERRAQRTTFDDSAET
jgi:hypothetical protein